MNENVTPLVPATLQPIPSIVAMLERLLEQAKTGEIRSIAAATYLSENRYDTMVETDNLLMSVGLVTVLQHSILATGRENATDIRP